MMELGKFIPWLPALGAVLCGLCCTRRIWRRWAALICITSIVAGFVISLLIKGEVPADQARVVPLFEWIGVGNFSVGFSYYFDQLTMVMLYVVTGIGALVAIYAAGYMKGDRGYARFFMGVCLFIFAMTTLVMADNLVLLYLGWEGVGLCSYLLIGFYYQKPSAVAAAKKAFIVNRIGDLGFALGIFLIWRTFGSVHYEDIIPAAKAMLSGTGDVSGLSQGAQQALQRAQGQAIALAVIPFLLMLGAFGKSAQIPLYMWLPDAMEGPTPVSALIHAATMVTAGVYMIARLIAIFELSPYALPTVAAIGGLTAIFAATIALCQYDIKRIFAYSTISQLGYMFMGVGALSTTGGIFHLFTHAFFKALLFLTAGSVMLALAGQLDLRKMSGLRRKMPQTCWLMFAGCLALAGLPPAAGFFSKDTILADTLAKGLAQDAEHPTLFILLAILGLLTALLTAFYSFRVWFRVFLGEERYEMGKEHHGENRASDTPGGTHVEHVHEPHEVSRLMNAPLYVLAAGAIFAGMLGGDWIAKMIAGSTAVVAPSDAPHEPARLLGMDLHHAMMLASALIALVGITASAWFHWLNRESADLVADRYRRLVRLLQNKYYVDEFNDAAIVKPLNLIGNLFYVMDRLVIDSMVWVVGAIPRMLGRMVQPTQRGALQGYAIGMTLGLAAAALALLLYLYLAM